MYGLSNFVAAIIHEVYDLNAAVGAALPALQLIAALIIGCRMLKVAITFSDSA
jgi:hypothetical protein